MAIVRAILAMLFILMGFGVAMQSWRVRRLGLLLAALVYAGAGAVSLALESWWPLIAGFVAAWSLRRLGADLPTDLRFDLPVIEREEVSDGRKLNEYIEKWLSTDDQVARVASRFVNEAWDRGFRKPAHIPDLAEWSASTAAEAWHQMVAADLRQVASSTKEATVRHLDQIDQLSTPTLMVAGDATLQYDLPAAPSHFAEIEGKIPNAQKRAEYATAYVADSLLAARLRVLAWTFQQWHGERYELPEKRRRPSR